MGKVALITGANHGIGRAVALAPAHADATSPATTARTANKRRLRRQRSAPSIAVAPRSRPTYRAVPTANRWRAPAGPNSVKSTY